MKRIEELIFDQAERRPDAIAVEYRSARLNYAGLKRQALQVSRVLRKSGLAPGGAVGILQHRSLTTIPLLLGIWDAGGIVVPINPNAPVKLLEWVVQNSALQIIVTEPSLKSRIATALENVDSKAVILTDGWEANGHSSNVVPTPGTFPSTAIGDSFHGPVNSDDCYVMYTSGSEGRPKGVRGSHESLIQYLRWQAEEFAVTGADRFSQTAPLSFDFSLKEFLVPLICGACVCIADRNTVIDPRKFLKWIADSKVTVMCCVPTLLRSILEVHGESPADHDFSSLRSVLISGDMLRWDDVTGWRESFGNSMSLFNLYGPTESTIIKLFYPIPQTKNAESVNVPVGKPITEAEVLILDEKDRLCDIGETGEIVILSEWLARGYVNQEQKANRSFCRVDHEGKSKSAYRTGDLGRLLKSGDVELIGRRDRQVKLRGYRIELGEIESVLSEHTAIKDVAVVVPATSTPIAADELGEIICYFTTDQPAVTEKEIRDFAQDRLLPQVLSLTRFSRLDKLPLTANGKVDRLKLQALGQTVEHRAETPATPNSSSTVQEQIQAMWEDLLAVDAIDVKANFFEIGGDSMTAIRLLRRMREELHTEIKLGDVYEFPSVSQLSDRVEQLRAG